MWRRARHRFRAERRTLLLERGFTDPRAKRASKIYRMNDALAGLWDFSPNRQRWCCFFSGVRSGKLGDFIVEPYCRLCLGCRESLLVVSPGCYSMPRNSSMFMPISLAICRRRNGERSLPSGFTQVHRGFRPGWVHREIRVQNQQRALFRSTSQPLQCTCAFA